MELNQQILQKTADIGSKKVAEAFATLAGSPAEVAVSKVETVPFELAVTRLKPPGNYAVVVHAQLLIGVPGASVLMLSREDSLALVDLLNGQEVGTTGILKDIDRSALKETLNILSNSYITALSEVTGKEITLGVPGMMTANRIEGVLDSLKEGSEVGETAIIFETTMEIKKYKIKATLYLLFNEKLAGMKL
ncbi:MAG: chemotaxis protein CheC [Candidatus Uhrbacteria bacterium]